MLSSLTGNPSTKRSPGLCRFLVASLFATLMLAPASADPPADPARHEDDATIVVVGPDASAETPEDQPAGAAEPQEPSFRDHLAAALAAGELATDNALVDALSAGDAHSSLLCFAIRADDPPGIREAVVRYAAGHILTDEVVMETLLELLPQAPDDQAVRLLDAAARGAGPARNRGVVRRILNFARTDPRAATHASIRASLFQALEYQSGCFDLGRDLEAWDAWWSDVQWIPESTWHTRLSDGHARHARQAETQATRLADRVEALYARLHARMNEDERAALMVELLRDDLPRARAFGFQLAFRTLLNAKPLKDEVVDAAAELLTDDIPALRAQAARLLEKRRRPGLDERVAGLLLTEEEPDVAAAMMRVMSHQPRPEALPAVMRWLVTDGPVYDAAVEALLAMHGAGMIAEEQLVSMHTVVRARLADRPTPAAIRLLARLGEVDLLIPFISAEDGALAVAAAESTWPHAPALPRLIEACRARPALWEYAARALKKYRPTPEGFALCRELPSTAAVDRDAMLVSYAAALSPEDLLQVVTIEPDPALRVRLLAPVAEPGFITDPPPSERMELVLALVRANLEIKRPESVLALLDGVAPALRTAPMEAYRVFCLLWLNRLEEAGAVTERSQVDAVVWIDALEASAAAPHAPAIRAEIERRFGEQLTDEQRARLEAMSATQDPQEDEP